MLVFASVVAAGSVAAQEQNMSTGLPGDQFSLSGALESFKKSTSPEEFEKLLNKAGNDVNNLDLNHDGSVDYIKVIGKKDTEKDVQLFILQVPVTEDENQDIAVIELERTGESEAVIQIVGDQDIFGEEVIIEPLKDNEDGGSLFNTGGNNHGPSYTSNLSQNSGLFCNVWGWPSVQYVYSPFYTGWISPWSWYDEPYWWEPYAPLGWSYWYPRRSYYQHYYYMPPQPRIVYARNIYRPMRCASVIVYNRHSPAVNYYRSNRRNARVYNHYSYPQRQNNVYNNGRSAQRDNNRYNNSDNRQREYNRNTETYNRQRNDAAPRVNQNNQLPAQRPIREFGNVDRNVAPEAGVNRLPGVQRPQQGFSRPNTVERRPPAEQNRTFGNSLPTPRVQNRQAPVQRPQQGFNRPNVSERRQPVVDRRASESPSRSFNRGSVNPGPSREFNRNSSPRTSRAGAMRTN